jgi:hypothetical protein
MKHSFFLFILIHLLVYTQAQIGIGTINPHASAKLDVSSTTSGFLPPRMTIGERNLISSPAEGLIIYNTTSGCINVYNGTQWREMCPTIIAGSVSALICGAPAITGSLTSGLAASGVTIAVSYTGGSGNGETHPGQIVTSTGISGLTATLPPGTFATGNSTLSYSISGTPSSYGTANFALNIGGQTCTLALPVFQCGASTVTFTYKGSTVTYGTVVGANNKCWLDRNLGASQVAVSTTDAAGYGDLFQWGRGDDNHQNRNSGTSSSLSSSDNAGSGSFILAPSTPNDWRSPQNGALWQGGNGVNNPCPSGYRLPTETELNTERINWSSNSAAGAFGSPLKLTMAGLRGYFGGSLGNVNTVGGYWSSTTTGTMSKYLYITDASNALINVSDRAVGFSVRCIKD